MTAIDCAIAIDPVHREQFIRVTVTVFLGIVPATILVIPAALLGLTVTGSVGETEYGDARFAVVTLAISAIAIAGYVSLWCTMRDRVSLCVAAGLVAGIVATAVGAVMLWNEGYIPNSAISVLFGGPALVAMWHISRWRSN